MMLWRILGYGLFALWCLSWLPTVVGLLSERPGEPPTPQESVIRLVCAANAVAFYVGGMIWLALRCSGRSGARVCLAWLVFVCMNGWGPVVLALAAALLGPSPRMDDEQPTEPFVVTDPSSE